MSLAVVFRKEAQADLDGIFTSYETARVGLGLRFYEQVKGRLRLIADHPKIFAIVHRQVRATKVPKFPYVIYYRVQANRIEIFAIVHGRRDTSAWKSRV
jgi:plasmid stabilization system protein ParE